ncbi:g2-specific kinase nima [Pyrenophora seminiperda CCB06]|uniref:G2-specific kinase nima n=1 Tax=Pyrenophora seminiperda CCB06 TaxID=1302712 RepID=A0A3M7LUW5_9PLEO|nr:g2-specific kinase nima [Pyrenophora seminiperda CCB06]
MATGISYPNLDHNDRHFFDHVLGNDVERLAFIRFFEHVEGKRPRTGTGRIKLWSRKTREKWIRRAQASQPLPYIHRPTQTVRPPEVLTLVAPIPAGTVSIAPIDMPRQDPTLVPPIVDATRSKEPVNIPPPIPLNLVTPALGTVGTLPIVRTSSSSNKRQRDLDPINPLVDDEQPAINKKRKVHDPSNLQHLAKTHLTDTGGERCPQFVLYNDVQDKYETGVFKALPPCKEQRQFIQKTLGGQWRFCKTLRQSSTRLPNGESRAGFPEISMFLFAKINDAGIIEERAVIKCRDVSIKNFSHHSAELEAKAATALQASNCRHIQRLIQSPAGLVQTLNFSLEGVNDPTSWKLHYQAFKYPPYGDLHTLIKNHQEADQRIPEHFCWFLFGSLVEALITCQTGYCNAIGTLHDGSHKPNWRSILHLQIHPANISFSEPNSQYYKFYQQPILGNFDKALCLDPDPVKRQAQFDSVRFKTIIDWQAPETCSRHSGSEDYAPSNWDLDHATDIFSLGSLIRYMMLSTTKPDPLPPIMKYEGFNFASEAKLRPEEGEWEFPRDGYPDSYSTVLIDTVQHCLAFRSKLDPQQPHKKYRPTLLELRNVINQQLVQLDAEQPGDIAKMQANPAHSQRVIFSKEDAQFAIGAKMPPVPQVDMAELIDVEATQDDKEYARKTWSAFLANAGKKRSMVSITATLAALSHVQERTREKYSNKIASKQQRLVVFLNALQFATNTMRKSINPTGKFEQLRQHVRSDFFSPRFKRRVLNSFSKVSHDIRQETLKELEAIKKDRKHTEDELMRNKAVLEAAHGANDEAKTREVASHLQVLQGQQGVKTSEIMVKQEKISSLELLRHATELGEALLILGSQLWPGEDVTEEHGNAMPSRSIIHRSVWEYFWARPDGVFF